MKSLSWMRSASGSHRHHRRIPESREAGSDTFQPTVDVESAVALTTCTWDSALSPGRVLDEPSVNALTLAHETYYCGLPALSHSA
jgi:hypothetical protein